MNEDRGAKGGYNDLRRTFILQKRNKETSDQELQELEKQVKKDNIKRALITFPLVLTGTMLKELVDNCTKYQISKFNFPHTTKKVKIQKKPEEKVEISLPQNFNSSEFTRENENHQVEISLPQNFNLSEFTQENKNYQVEIPLPKEANLPLEENLISKYQDSLELIYLEYQELKTDYEILETSYENIYEKKELEELLTKMKLLLSKIEELKNKIEANSSLKETSRELYDLVNEYLENYSVEELNIILKDSDIYQSLSSKIAELEQKKNSLDNKLEDKKEQLNIDYEKFDKTKKDYEDLYLYYKDLLAFALKQEQVAYNLREQVANSTKLVQHTTSHIRYLRDNANHLRNLTAAAFLVPGPTSIKAVALGTAMYLNTMNNILHPQVETTTYTTVETKDYETSIVAALNTMNDSIDTLKNTTIKVSSMIEYLEKEYKDYFDNVKELKELLENLKEIKNSLYLKEEELTKIKKEEEITLQENNAKVKVLTTD